MACWSSKGVSAWPAGRPREYQHGLLVVQGSISMACWSSQPSVPQHTHLQADICLALFNAPFSTFNHTTQGISSSVVHGPYDNGKTGKTSSPDFRS